MDKNAFFLRTASILQWSSKINKRFNILRKGKEEGIYKSIFFKARIPNCMGIKVTSTEITKRIP
jgi:hypothetical protein